MRYVAVATDYKSTLAIDGRGEYKTIAALERLIQSDRKIMLITGRLLADILRETAAVMEKLFGEIGGKAFHPPVRNKERP